jgi:aldehyde dehydrogenase (NAD+)
MERPAATSEMFDKLDPATGRLLCRVARSREQDVERAVGEAREAFRNWRGLTPVARGDHLRALAIGLREREQDFARIVAQETGKSVRDARAEVNAAVEMGFFVAGEGRRWYGRTTTSAVPNKAALVVRQPLGIAGLIVAANTPAANVAWKVFPALMCGNTAVLKAAEDTPATAWAFAAMAHQVGLPPGVLNVVQGYGEEAGAPLVAHQDVAVVSFTGSCEVGRTVGRVAGGRLAKVCLELGGKNPLIVCDDADIDRAVEAAVLSAFSNAGQRCAAGSRLIVLEGVYEEFRSKLVERIRRLRVGTSDDDDYGPVINAEQLSRMLASVEGARERGACILTGGVRLTGPGYEGGFFIAPTLIEGADADDESSVTELFGPIASLFRASSFDEALALGNGSPFGLTAAIWTRDIHRAMEFLNRIESGVAVVNGPTYGSEPHMPFGGLKQSGNGLREAGTEAMDVYSDWKTVYINYDPAQT